MTVLRKVRFIFEERFIDLRSENEKRFVADMYDGLDGLSITTNDEDISDYLTPRQTEWINDIYSYLNG